MKTVLLLLLAIPALCAAAPASKTDSAATFTKDIAPLLQKHCQECHHNGGMAPMPLVSWEETRPWAKSIKERTRLRKMPPFDATGPIGHFENDPRLTNEQISLLAKWVDGGAPRGDSKYMPAPATFPSGWVNGPPNLVLSMRKPYTVKRNSTDDYEFFAFDYVFQQDTWMSGVDIRPGNRRSVHHVNIHSIPVDLKTDPDGRIEGLSMVGTFLTGWAPGAGAKLQPPGYATLMRKGTRLGIQVHYAPTTEEVVDPGTSIGFYFADGHITHRGALLHGGTRNIVIPPGEANYQIIEKRTFPTDGLVKAFTAHMHLRGKSFVVKLHYPDGRVETAFDIPQYDFNWQRNYRLAKPISVPKGTVAEYIATWDNSANNKFNPDPKAAVVWGEKTVNEMMGGFLNYEDPSTNLDVWVDGKTGRRLPGPPASSSAANANQ